MRNKKALLELAYETSIVYASALPGEQFHKDYQKNKDVFRLVVKSDRQMEKKLAEYFKELGQRLALKLNLSTYQLNVKAFDLASYIDADWDGEILNLKIIITEAMKNAIIAGGIAAEEELKIDIGWNGTSKPALDFLNKYSLKLAKGLNDTTIDKVKSALQTSLDNGESTTDAIARLTDVIDDPKRAATIAHTESVRAFSQGKLAVAEEVGAEQKEWATTYAPCAICDPLNGLVVGIDEEFDGEYDAPPAHPNCRCILRLVLKPSE